MRKKNGFTLVELLAVIVILALVLVISIPAIMGTTGDAKKQSFYLYAQSLYSKTVKQYNEDVDDTREALNCKTYNISRDLGISNTGDYKGWVQVKREAVAGDKRVVTINVTRNEGIYHVNYCVVKGDSCTPNTGYSVEEDQTSVDVKETLEEGYTLCVNQEYPDGDSLTTSSTTCKGYSEGASQTNTYKYKVIITMSDRNYAVENYTIEGMDVEDTSQEKKRFYDAIKSYETNHPNELKALPIYEPVCEGQPVNNVPITNPVNDGTTVATNRTTNPTGNVNDTTRTTSTNGSVTATTGNQSTNGTTVSPTGVNTTRGTVNPGNQTTDPVRTTNNNQTTVDTRNANLLLSNLSIDGLNLNFEPTKFYYELTVANSMSSVTVRATKQGNSTLDFKGIDANGHASLKVGANILSVIVQDNESGATSTYKIVLTRLSAQGTAQTTQKTYDQDEPWNPDSGIPDPMLDESNALLKAIVISGGYSINFEPTTYAYDLVTKGDDMLVLDVIQQVPGGQILIDGNENLSKGGQILITSISQNGYYSKKYIITITANPGTTKLNNIIRWITIILSIILAFLLINIASRQIRNRRVNKEIDKLAQNRVDESRRERKEETSVFNNNQPESTAQNNTQQDSTQPVQIQEQSNDDNPFNSQG